MSTDLVLEGTTERAITPLSLIQDALSKNVAPEVLKELVALQQSMVRFQWESENRQAKNDFDDALNSCQSEIGRIAPNQKRNDTGSFWADYSQLDRTIRPIYTARKFSVSYTEIAPLVPGKVRIQASLSRCGISKEFSTEITPSTIGPKGGVMATATDADAIAASRAKRYLLIDIFNIAIGIDQVEAQGIPDEDKYLQAIRTADTVESLKKVFANAWRAAQGNKVSEKVLSEAKNERRKQLAGSRGNSDVDGF
jgi:hypothetical protein